MTRFAKLLLAALTGLTVSAAAPGARAADLSGTYWQDTGVCSEAWVLNKITHRFHHQVRHVPNLPQVGIVDFRGIRERGYQPASQEWPIGRRYCQATVALSDGHDRAIWYLIEEGQGFASVGDNVEFCVAGFDRWMVYNGRCRILR
jgi:capsid protein